MFGFTKDSAPGKRKKKRSNLEFDFITGPVSNTRSGHIKKSVHLATPPPVEPEPPMAEPEPVAAEPTEPIQSTVEPPPEPVAAEPSVRPEPTPQPEPEFKEEEPPPMSSPFNEPTPIRVSESIRRQQKEQRTTNTMINGVILTIICAILLVTILAGTGAYVMWKQIKGQSATIALLEDHTNARFTALQNQFTAANQKLADSLAQTSQQLQDLNNQLVETEKNLAETQKTITDLRRTQAQAQAQAQRRMDDQDAAINRLRARQSQSR